MLICKLTKQMGERARTIYEGREVLEGMCYAFDETTSGDGEGYLFFDILDRESTVMVRSNFIRNLDDLHKASRVLEFGYKTLSRYTVTRVAVMKMAGGGEEIFHVKSVPAAKGFDEKEYAMGLTKLIDEVYPHLDDEKTAMLIVREILGESLVVNEYHVESGDLVFLKSPDWEDTLKSHSMIAAAISPTAER